MTSGQPDDGAAALLDAAPCGLVQTRPDGVIVRVNGTLARWVAREPAALLGERLQSLLTMPSAMLFETHCAPMLRMQGHIGEVAIDLRGPDGGALPVLLWASVELEDGAPRWLRVMVANAGARREYERELLAARTRAEDATAQLRRQAELLAEHSALLIPVQRDLRVMPVLGAIDATRGRHMLRALLELDAAAGVRAVILDLTGVPELDAAAAEVLRRAAVGLRLRGVLPIVTGLRPAVAARLVAGGLDLAGIAACGTLQDGIALANRSPR